MIEEPPLLTIRRRPTAGGDTAAAVSARHPRAGWSMRCRVAVRWTPRSSRCAPEVAGMRRFVGTALTCWCGPNDNLALMAAVSLAEPGRRHRGRQRGFRRRRDGRRSGGRHGAQPRSSGHRDRRHGPRPRRDHGGWMPVFCRGVTPNSCVRSGPGTVGLPIVVGGLPVNAGDLVVGDGDGIVVVPQDRLDDVGRRLASIAEAERHAEPSRQGRPDGAAGNRGPAGVRSRALDRLAGATPAAAPAARCCRRERGPSPGTGPGRPRSCRAGTAAARGSPRRARP